MRDFERAEDNRLAAALQRLDADALAPAPPPTSQWRAAVVGVVVATVALSVGTWVVAQSRHDTRTPAVAPVMSDTPSAAASSVVPSPTSLGPTPSARATSTQPTSAQSTSVQLTSPTAGASAPPASPAVPSSTDIVGGSAWNSHILVITGHSLGGVTIGMSSAAAAHAAGVAAFTEVGDGVLQPSGPLGSSQPRLYLSNFAGQPAASVGGDFSCVEAAGSASGTSSVVTARGLRLGDPATRVREIYGAAANFIPMPTTGGIDPNPGYVVHQGQFDLVFKLDPSQSRVITIAGGLAPMTPSECNG